MNTDRPVWQALANQLTECIGLSVIDFEDRGPSRVQAPLQLLDQGTGIAHPIITPIQCP